MIYFIQFLLKSNHQSTLHRHLSNESQREQADIITILDQHGDDSVVEDEEVVDEEEEEEEERPAGKNFSPMLYLLINF